MVIEKAKRLVEHKKDVVILLDSITRLARATTPSCRRRARCCRRRRRERAAAAQALLRRGPERRGGGSLTIIATALIETGSRMDDVIFGSSRDRQHGDPPRSQAGRSPDLPSIELTRSGTRKEELLLAKKELDRSWVLRKVSELPVAGRGDGAPDRADAEEQNNEEFSTR